MMALRIAFYGLLVLTLGGGIAQAQVPIPSTWEGKATGRVYGIDFSLPVVIEISEPLPYEKNPFHLFVGSASMTSLGDVLLTSAMRVGAGGGEVRYNTGSAIGVYAERTTPHSSQKPAAGGAALLQYLTIKQEGSQATAVLTNVNMKEAAAVNAFTGPNVSAKEASALMRGVLEGLGTTENFVFLQGATLQLRFNGSSLNGSIAGKGRSVLNTTSDIEYSCRIQANRIR
jgi:hypothetical protein